MLNVHHQFRFSLSLTLTWNVNTHWFVRFCSKVNQQNCPSTQCFFYTGSWLTEICIWDETWGLQIALPTTLTLLFFFVLLVLYTQDTFTPFLNFKVGHFARHFLFLSFGVAMKGIQFTQLCYHISSLIHHLFYFYPAMYNCWIWSLEGLLGWVSFRSRSFRWISQGLNIFWECIMAATCSCGKNSWASCLCKPRGNMKKALQQRCHSRCISCLQNEECDIVLQLLWLVYSIILILLNLLTFILRIRHASWWSV